MVGFAALGLCRHPLHTLFKYKTMKIRNPEEIGENIKKNKSLQEFNKKNGLYLDNTQLSKFKAGNCCSEGEGGLEPPDPPKTTMAMSIWGS